MSLEPASWPGERTYFALLLGYFALHALLRTLVSSSVQLDEAEQLLVAQKLAWGYSSQPPLYDWLQWGFIQLFGWNVFALALLKNLLLCGTFVLALRVAARLAASTPQAGVAAASLFLLPGLVWESQRDQTHLVLATFLALALVLSGLRVIEVPSWPNHLLLGFVGACGVLAKYNFAIVLAAFLLAALTLPAGRRALARPAVLLALAGFVVILAPHLSWAWSHREVALSQSGKFQMQTQLSVFSAALKGIAQFCTGVLGTIAAPLVLLGLLGFRPKRGSEASSSNTPCQKLVWRTLWAGLALSLVCILAFHVTKVKARWFQPLLVVFPIVLGARLAPGMSAAARRVLLILVLAIMVLVPTVMYGSVVAAGWTKRPTNLNAPFQGLSAGIRAAGFSQGIILAENQTMGGNLKLCFPQAVVVTPEIVPPGFRPQWPLLLVWKAEGTNRVGPAMVNFGTSLGYTNLQALPPLRASAPALYTSAPLYAVDFALQSSMPSQAR